jgi:peptidoglycan/xylan/chitin deacetylase (PgdA/CDA1 family)
VPPGYRSLLAARIKRLPADAAARAAKRKARVAAKRGAGLILYYHRIDSPPLDPWRTAVSPQSFDDQLEYLASEMRVIPLAEMVTATRNGDIPERAVAITFDDGYVDNLERGLPLLERHGLPATFYIATGYVGTRGPLWWDEIGDLLLGPGERPPELNLEIGRVRIHLPTVSVEERRIALFGEINPALKKLPAGAVDSALEPIRAWAGGLVTAPSGDGTGERRPMSERELERLAASELVELGAHTALHPSLPALPEAAQREEVLASREMLTELRGTPPRSFAYPFGDNDGTSRRVVREAGFDHAVGVQEYVPTTTAAHDFEIPRMMAFDESAAALEKRMRIVLDFADPA